jgi:hypothetical protein
MSLVAAALSLAIVTQDQTALRAAPRDSAQQQAQLWQGDSLEVRGEKGDFLQVWDHRRERGGYIRSSQVRSLQMTPAEAPQMLAVVNFLRDTPRAEALGIGYAAAFLKAAPAEMITPEAFDAIGTMADRIARRASSGKTAVGDAHTAEHLEVLASYGVTMTSFEREGQVQLCYEGDAFRRVLALPGSAPLLRARAALALTRHECVSPDLTPADRANLDAWRMDVLNRVDTASLPEHVKNRILMRRAGILASIVYQQQRRGENAQETANRAIESLAAINKSELTEDDNRAYSDAATRTGVSRWAASDAVRAVSTLSVAVHAGQPGETCVQVVDAKLPAPLFEKCTWGIVYPASAAPNAEHTALALAVQTLDTWRELWLFRKGAQGWYLEVIPPTANGPDIGYIDFAGWVPGGKQMLLAREVRNEGNYAISYKRSYELVNMDSLQVERWADKPESLTPFYRWQDPAWKRMTLMLR